MNLTNINLNKTPHKEAPSKDNALRGQLEAMPKTELHLHLEGAIPLRTLWELIRKYGGDPDIWNFQDLQNKFRYTNFTNFINTWIWKNGFLREYEDFRLIGEAVSSDLANQNIHYVEAFYSPGDFVRHGLDPCLLTEALHAGLELNADRIRVNLIADLVRDFGPEKGSLWLEQIAEVKALGVIGIGLGGSEVEFPAAPYEKVFDRARALGFHTTAHAGEADGAASVRSALVDLKVERIGHGLNAAKDPQLMEMLADLKIPLEMCPISNLRTRCIHRLEDHPIREFLRQGIVVTVNTDDPKMFNTSLATEFESLHKSLKMTLPELEMLAFNSIEAAWCSDHLKNQLRDEMRQFLTPKDL